MGPQRPGIKVMAANLMKTAKDVFNGAISGSTVLASEEVSNNRINICNNCEFFFKESNRCNKCGCFMNAKVKFQAATCPMQKW